MRPLALRQQGVKSMTQNSLPLKTMSSLIPKTTAQKLAEEIDQMQSELINHNEAILKVIHSKANTKDEQQNILDVFSNGATAALTKYGTIYAAIVALNPDTTVPAPDLSQFVPNQDGTVTYVAPPELEPVIEPQLDPEP